ncbi:hypothetical protein [Bacillus sp. MUM 13]|uniref:hypothetical protein n=1 Tax=Bacillus sp. MUM 13 TaxID=1678001 RepID=UPI0008F59C94|nr:hypothetical protein [Bacillus sp. MUM 13]OIK09401.1 hypothetical protein BIV59_17145 [Bacillus sp. MUM 13]
MEYQFNEKLHPQQSGLVIDFMDSLEKDDINLFWSTLSREDKAYIEGTFNALQDSREQITFYEWKNESFRRAKEVFVNYISNYGVSTTVRHYNKILADIYLPHGVEVPIKYIAESEVRVMKLPITLEVNQAEDGQILVEWKVYFYANKNL